MPEPTPEIRTVAVTRYVTPLREGGSLPAIVEADDEFLYALKFRGAGQGAKALIAELIAGELARALGLQIPELVFATLDACFGRSEADEEIQDLLRASEGLNLGLHYLSGAITFDPLVNKVDARLASQIVWLDSLILNVDRTVRNTNLLMWQKQLWLIDHGAAFFFHHSWTNWQGQGTRAFPQIKDHVLLPAATELPAVNTDFSQRLNPGILQGIVSLIPDEWLLIDSPFETNQEHRNAYLQFMQTRLAYSNHFTQEATDARAARI